MWRGASIYFSMNTRSSPKLARPSRFTDSNPSRTSFSVYARRMPLPPPPADAFIITGKPMPLAIFTASAVVEMAGDDVHARFLRELLGLDLVAHRRDRLGRRADEGDAGLGQRLGEALALAEETVARVHRLGAGRLAR